MISAASPVRTILAVLPALLAVAHCNGTSETTEPRDEGRLELALKAQGISGLLYGLAGKVVLDDPESSSVVLDELDSASMTTLDVLAGTHQLELCSSSSGSPACVGVATWMLYELSCPGSPTATDCLGDAGTAVASPVAGAVLVSDNPQSVRIDARATTHVTLAFEVPGRGTVTFGRGTLELVATVQEGLSDGRPCSADANCQSRVCADDDGDGVDTCQPATCSDGVLNDSEVDVDCGGACPPCVVPQCDDNGTMCAADADCCSLSCENSVCSTGSACLTSGNACGGADDCCSTSCVSGVCVDAPTSCDPIGEACVTNGDCCSARCADSTGSPCGTTGDCRCAAPFSCRAEEETCTQDSQCCTGTCDRPNGTFVGTCAVLGACAVTGEPCIGQGVNGSCCSGLCGDPSGTGTPTCQKLSGCAPEQEVCKSDEECCSGACAPIETSADGRDIRRCVKAAGCSAAGEICVVGGSSDCCPAGGGTTGCELTAEGAFRCHGGDSSCTLPSQECATTAECCTDLSTTITCAPTSARINACCLPNGEPCAFDDLCCSGRCTGDATGMLRCQ